MERPVQLWQHTLAAVLTLGGCAFDTAPIHATGTAGAAALTEAGASVAESVGHAVPDMPAAISSSGNAAAGAGGADGAAPVSTGGAGGASDPLANATPSLPATAGAPAPAGMLSPAPAQMPACDGLGSYALKLTADVAWDATNGFAEAGRGPAQIIALVDVRRVDAQSGALEAEAQVCGLVLPTLRSPFSCSPFELRFADKLWDRRELPHTKLTGSWACAANGCKLQLTPELTLGIQLDPAQPTWPAPGSTQVSQYPDDDGDGQPGLSADLVSLSASSPGNGNGNGNGNPACGYTPFGAAASMANMGDSDAGRMLLGLRAQLTAAIGLATDCHVTASSGELRSLGLRAAGCELRAASWTFSQSPTAGNSNDKSPCSEELRTTMDQGLPNYQVLAAGQTPAAPPTGTTTTRDMSPSKGPELRAVRFLRGVQPNCEQVRQAMF